MIKNIYNLSFVGCYILFPFFLCQSKKLSYFILSCLSIYPISIELWSNFLPHQFLYLSFVLFFFFFVFVVVWECCKWINFWWNFFYTFVHFSVFLTFLYYFRLFSYSYFAMIWPDFIVKFMWFRFITHKKCIFSPFLFFPWIFVFSYYFCLYHYHYHYGSFWLLVNCLCYK